ncbi:MAG: hypothetical protein AAB736_02080 [Patescibacteria group bacterium]
MKNKIITISVMSVFIFGLLASSASAQTSGARKPVERKIERKVERKMSSTTNGTSTSSFRSSKSWSSPEIPGVASSTNVICIKTAVEAREGRIIEIQVNSSSDMKTALETRKSALISAWSIYPGKDRRDAIKGAWNAFKSTSKTIGKALKDNNKSAWATFESATKPCKLGDGQGLSEENAGKGIDTSSSN